MWVFWKNFSILPHLEGKPQFFLLCLSFLCFSITIHTENYISDTSAQLCGGFPHIFMTPADTMYLDVVWYQIPQMKGSVHKTCPTLDVNSKFTVGPHVIHNFFPTWLQIRGSHDLLPLSLMLFSMHSHGF